MFVIEASSASGAKIQARLALEHGKKVFLPRSLVTDQQWARDYVAGVVEVTDVAEVTSQLALTGANQTESQPGTAIGVRSPATALADGEFPAGLPAGFPQYQPKGKEETAPARTQGPSGHGWLPMAGYEVRLCDEGGRSKMTSAAGSIERVATYVDGFNLYYGIRQGGRQHLWLDLEELARSLLKPHQQLVAVRYFTAPRRDDPAALSRQQLYWNALDAHSSLLEIRVGRFQRKSKRCFSCNNSWVEYEEKESDVALGAAIVADGARGIFDTAMIISADSDMASAVRELKSLVPGVRVVAAFPPNRNSSELIRICDAFIRIGDAKVRRAQLPETVWADGHSIARPDYWR